MNKSNEPSVSVYINLERTKCKLARTRDVNQGWTVIATYPHALDAKGYPLAAINRKLALMREHGIQKNQVRQIAQQSRDGNTDDSEKFLINGVWRALKIPTVTRLKARFIDESPDEY